ncbi:putative Formimidoyltransferase-cyclodeaminase [Nitrospira japonica]|uniref:Formimidoyltransferase-cyclodeaminase n=1 Tax=Nitrospira japonica TaxID=1325564 RepID=A0A1W1I278_9BACT|nr:glutamate formimidoyltransferase [Nitrospira japonica]SLM46969.1 putative Formimidoyltransferase-cyclodeaminase [Nitrospira japonica]
MDHLVTCVPNFSEGRNRTTVHALIRAVQSVPGVMLLDWTMDPDHHRSVLTFVGEPDAAADAAFRAIRVATRLIDIRKHRGVHPRIGATDVVPFVPAKGVTAHDCVRLARRLGERVGRQLEIPVFLYEQAAAGPDRAPLESVRRGGLEGLARRMRSDRRWRPDFGPATLHRTAGAVVIGARPPLIAFNVNLQSGDLEVSRSIARTIRESNGGMSHVKAIGVELSSRGMVQVAMNLTDYRVTPVHAVFEAVQALASLHGVAVADSEIVGLVPQAALVDAAADALRLESFDRSLILEKKIESALEASQGSVTIARHQPARDLRALSVGQLLDAIAAATPSPAGASVSALVASCAVSLGIMGARLSRRRGETARLASIAERLGRLAQADGVAYGEYLEASRLPASDSRRPARLAQALHRATQIPLQIAELTGRAGKWLYIGRQHVKQRVQADSTVGIILCLAAAEASLHIAGENIKHQINRMFIGQIEAAMRRTAICLEELRRLCYTPPPDRSVIKEKSAQARPEKAQKRREWKSRSSITTLKRPSRSPRRSSQVKGFSGN